MNDSYSQMKLRFLLNTLDCTLEDLKLKINERILVHREFMRYHNAVWLERTPIAIENRQLLRNAVERNFKVFEKQGIRQFIDQSLAFLPETTKKNIVDSESIKAAIIYELLSKYYEE